MNVGIINKSHFFYLIGSEILLDLLFAHDVDSKKNNLIL